MDAWQQFDNHLFSAPEAAAVANAMFYYGNVPYYSHQSLPDNNTMHQFDYTALYEQELMQVVGVGIPYDPSILELESACSTLNLDEAPFNNWQRQTQLHHEPLHLQLEPVYQYRPAGPPVMHHPTPRAPEQVEEWAGIVRSIEQDAAAASKKPSRKSRRRVFKSIEPLACYFCRGRKIACGPLPGSHDKSCWQCVKRGMACIYPTESRRGQRRLSTRRRGNGAGPSTHAHSAPAMARL
ncbi:hypothetical protein BV25DRAFT_1823237 [Artomyces pyxidatus]|uniref:Uncharacterized protein n=1 Tax=Artomyces pyxidatus TaxID=48021 RepID=A0ACB8T809_9AGAM|nr:hypothetical protein BV25DRAFT_1823237 [Artomyces pyxidatus]